MFFKICLVLCSVLFGKAHSASTYDQSQNGDLNVQVDLKDLHIIALMKGGKEEYVDYDYAYDYSEMTIKPQHGVTQKPLNTTNSSDVPENATVSAVTTFESTSDSTTTHASPNLDTNKTIAPALPENISSTTIKSFIDVTTQNNPGKDKNHTIPASNIDCKKGFVLNQKGDCELQIASAGNTLLKLVKLSQKLKLRRENRLKGDQPE